MTINSLSKDKKDIILEEFRSNGLSVQDILKRISKRTGMSVMSLNKAYYRENSYMNIIFRENGFDKNSVNVREDILNYFSENEINVCMIHISKNADNLSHAFRLSAKELNRSFSSIKKSWYGKDGCLYNYRKNKSIFKIVGDSSIFRANVKNNIAKGKTSL